MKELFKDKLLAVPIFVCMLTLMIFFGHAKPADPCFVSRGEKSCYSCADGVFYFNPVFHPVSFVGSLLFNYGDTLQDRLKTCPNPIFLPLDVVYLIIFSVLFSKLIRRKE